LFSCRRISGGNRPIGFASQVANRVAEDLISVRETASGLNKRIRELGEWDEAMLRDEIAGLLAEDFDLSLLGIADEDLDALLRDPDQGEGSAVEGEDDIPEPPVTPVSVAGDLWHLGSHRLICGDSTSADVVGRPLDNVKPLLMVTDPPHGVEYDPS
jgi:hypothetical protein